MAPMHPMVTRATGAAVSRGLSLIQVIQSTLIALTIGNLNINGPGIFVSKSDVQSPPDIAFYAPDFSITYIAVLLDLDAPYPDNSTLSPILHWMQPGFQPQESATGIGPSTLTSSEPFIANFVAPQPPSDSAPHRFLFMLYEQPAGFNGSEYAPPNGQNMSDEARYNYDIDGFASKAGLQEVVAASHIMVGA